jgi:pSer/pThr/pTyr-binding forkhead associated (FHA) protein
MIPEDVTLVVIEGDLLGQRIAIGDAPVVIGRGLGVDLYINDPTVSRHHCVIWRASGRCWVRDLGSTNRTRINDRAAPISELLEGDVLAVGQTALALSVSRAAEH